MRQEIDFGDVINPCKKSNTVLDALLGKTEKDAPEEVNIEFMTIAGGYICQMYNTVLKCRGGIG